MDPSPILYWFPDTCELPPALAARFRRGGGTLEMASVTRSPGPVPEMRGLLACPWSGTLPAYQPERQRWDQTGPGIWLGVDRQTARPSRFQRRDGGVPGVWVTLADGHDWLVPVANPFCGRCTLPSWAKLAPDGTNWTTEIQDPFADLSRRAAEVAADLRRAVLEGREAVTLDDAALRRLIADALAVNYDVTLAELSVLRVFSSPTDTAAVHAIVDWATQIEALHAAGLAAAAGGSAESAAAPGGAAESPFSGAGQPGAPGGRPGAPGPGA